MKMLPLQDHHHFIFNIQYTPDLIRTLLDNHLESSRVAPFKKKKIIFNMSKYFLYVHPQAKRKIVFLYLEKD